MENVISHNYPIEGAAAAKGFSGVLVIVLITFAIALVLRFILRKTGHKVKSPIFTMLAFGVSLIASVVYFLV